MSGRDWTADGPADVAQAPTVCSELLPGLAGFAHSAMLYDGSDQDLGRAATEIVRHAVESGVPLHIAVPVRAMRLVGAALRLTPRTAFLADITDLGRNP